MKHLVHDELNSAVRRHIVQSPHLLVAERCAGRVVRRVHQQESRSTVNQRPPLVEIEVIVVLWPKVIVTHLESEGLRESQIQKAEGEKQASILRAQGLAEARLAMAHAESEAVKLITASLPPGEAAMYLLGLKYLDALPQLAQGKGATIFLPAEAAGVMGAIGGMKALLQGPRDAAPSAPAPGSLGLPK